MKKREKKAGLFGLFSLGFGAIVGVGWSVTLNNLMIMGGGPIPTAFGFLSAVIFLVPIVLCFAEMTSSMPVAGGVIAYAYRAFGSSVSFIGGWFVILAYVSILPWEAIAINDIIAYIFPALRSGEIIYRIAGEDIYLRCLIVGLVLSIAIIAINWRGANFAAKFQSGLTIVLISCGLLCIVFLILNFSFGNLTPVYQSMPQKNHASFLAGVLAITAIGPFYFSGFDTIPQGAEDIGAGIPPKKLGKVLIITALAAGLFYLSILITAGAAYPWQIFIGFDRPALSTLMKSVYPGFLGQALFWISLTGTLAGLFTTWNGFYIAGSRMLLGMARARFLPKFFLVQHPKHKTPVGGSVFCGAVMIAGPFLGIGIIDGLTLLGSTGFVVGWFLVCVSALKLRYREPEMLRPYKMPGGKITAIIACITSGFMVINCVVPGMPGYMSNVGLMIFIIWIILGIAFYSVTSKYRMSVDESERMNSIFLRKS